MDNSLCNLRDKWKPRNGSEVFKTTFIQRLNICDFTFIWERSEFHGKITNLSYSIRSVFEPSLRNLPTRLSTIVALLVLNFFNIFEIETELFQIWVFFTNVNFLVILVTISFGWLFFLQSLHKTTHLCCSLFQEFLQVLLCLLHQKCLRLGQSKLRLHN